MKTAWVLAGWQEWPYPLEYSKSVWAPWHQVNSAIQAAVGPQDLTKDTRSLFRTSQNFTAGTKRVWNQRGQAPCRLGPEGSSIKSCPSCLHGFQLTRQGRLWSQSRAAYCCSLGGNLSLQWISMPGQKSPPKLSQVPEPNHGTELERRNRKKLIGLRWGASVPRAERVRLLMHF
jgi:hypothetical protein